MFVRWQKYKSQTQPTRMKAILVESVRIDGKPRQKHIAFLGSVDDQQSQRPRFWRTVRKTLDRLQLSRADRKRVEAAIGKTVPPMSAQERRQAERDLAALFGRLRGSHATGPPRR